MSDSANWLEKLMEPVDVWPTDEQMIEVITGEASLDDAIQILWELEREETLWGDFGHLWDQLRSDAPEPEPRRTIQMLLELSLARKSGAEALAKLYKLALKNRLPRWFIDEVLAHVGSGLYD